MDEYFFSSSKIKSSQIESNPTFYSFATFYFSLFLFTCIWKNSFTSPDFFLYFWGRISNPEIFMRLSHIIRVCFPLHFLFLFFFEARSEAELDAKSLKEELTGERERRKRINFKKYIYMYKKKLWAYSQFCNLYRLVIVIFLRFV